MLREKGRIHASKVDDILSWSSSGFSAHGAVRAQNRDEAARLGRSMIRYSLVLERLDWNADQGALLYHASPRRADNPCGSVARWDVLEFIGHLTRHIPDTSVAEPQEVEPLAHSLPNLELFYEPL